MDDDAGGNVGELAGSHQVAVVGGGIGGLGAAIMLGRQGVDVVVLERAEEFTEVGAGLNLGPNVTRMLERLGLLEPLLPTAVRPDRFVFRNAVSGRELTHIDLEDAHHRYGGPYIVLHRADLLDTLLAAARALPTVRLETRAEVTTLDDRGDDVVVGTASGERFSAQIVIGADGLRSRVREEISDDEPIETGYVAYRGTVPVADLDHGQVSSDITVWLGPGLHLVQYPVRSGDLLNQVAVFRSDEYAAGASDWGTPEELDRRYEEMAEPVRRALPALQRNYRWPMFHRNFLPVWSRGRITLLGDAAHAMLQYLGQGAVQSLLDGESLARHLARLPDGSWSRSDVAAALAAYEEDRVAESGSVQAAAKVWGEIWHVESGAPMVLRDELFSSRDITDYSHIDWLYGPAVGEATRPPAPVGPAPAAGGTVAARGALGRGHGFTGR